MCAYVMYMYLYYAVYIKRVNYIHVCILGASTLEALPYCYEF